MLVTVGGCGGGDGDTSSGGSGSSGSGSGGTSGSWTAGVFKPSAGFQNQCASPRTGTDPATGKRYPDVQGSTLAENNFLRSWTNELYLWYREVPDLNPASYSTSDYFNLLKTSATTPSGNPKDRFHFTYPTAEWVALVAVRRGSGLRCAVPRDCVEAAPPRRGRVHGAGLARDDGAREPRLAGRRC